MNNRISTGENGIVFVTGTDTGVGKTILTSLLVCHLRRIGIHALAMKPFATGGWGDARLLRAMQDGELSLPEITPFFFPEPAAPLAAARAHRKKIPLTTVVETVLSLKARCDVLLVEGIGGLRVPLGEKYDVADLILELKPRVIVAATNRLGVLNASILTVRDMQSVGIEYYTFVLMGGSGRGLAARTNARILAERVRPNRFVSLPHLGKNIGVPMVLKKCAKKFSKTLALIPGTGRLVCVATLKAMRRGTEKKLENKFDSLGERGKVTAL